MTSPTGDTRRTIQIAAHAGPDALFAALQAALLVIVDLAAAAGRLDQLADFEAPIRRALIVGDTLGSDADLAARDRGESTGHDLVRDALRRPAPGKPSTA